VGGFQSSGRVLIADEDETAREQLARQLEATGYSVIQVASGEQALEAVKETRPSIVLLEIPLGALSGYEVCRALRAEIGGQLPIVFVSGARTESYDRVAGLLVGADDYIVKPYAQDELLTRVRNLLRRTQPLSPAVASKLTKRELEVLYLVADGLRADEIANRLFISKKTVGTHLENMRRKLGVRSQAQAVALAYGSGPNMTS
jgi:DNA-binding NarL/FixJ family response regulator